MEQRKGEEEEGRGEGKRIGDGITEQRWEGKGDKEMEGHRRAGIEEKEKWERGEKGR